MCREPSSQKCIVFNAPPHGILYHNLQIYVIQNICLEYILNFRTH
nr:MAG TPA: hypothetical protein [Caudoviricetes sp.]